MLPSDRSPSLAGSEGDPFDTLGFQVPGQYNSQNPWPPGGIALGPWRAQPTGRISGSKKGVASALRSQSPPPLALLPKPRGGCPMVPWATLALVATNVALFWHPIYPPSGACLSVQTVWEQGQWGRVLWAPFHHLGICHLLVNMSTLLWLGWGLEQEIGTLRTGVLLLALALMGGFLHLMLNSLLALVTGQPWYWEHCAVGFSGGARPILSWCTAGVLFSLEAMGRQLEPFPLATMASGIAITTRWLCILECLALALFYPRSSFTGHLSGILVGLTLSGTQLLSGII